MDKHYLNKKNIYNLKSRTRKWDYIHEIIYMKNSQNIYIDDERATQRNSCGSSFRSVRSLPKACNKSNLSDLPFINSLSFCVRIWFWKLKISSFEAKWPNLNFPPTGHLATWSWHALESTLRWWHFAQKWHLHLEHINDKQPSKSWYAWEHFGHLSVRMLSTTCCRFFWSSVIDCSKASFFLKSSSILVIKDFSFDSRRLRSYSVNTLSGTCFAMKLTVYPSQSHSRIRCNGHFTVPLKSICLVSARIWLSKHSWHIACRWDVQKTSSVSS